MLSAAPILTYNKVLSEITIYHITHTHQTQSCLNRFGDCRTTLPSEACLLQNQCKELIAKLVLQNQCKELIAKLVLHLIA